MIARRVIVRGHVQGVFFRDSTQQEAASRGVAGWVRNREDGSVEAWFEGDEDAVQSMVEWSRRGPARAQVDGIEVLDAEPDGLGGFDVR